LDEELSDTVASFSFSITAVTDEISNSSPRKIGETILCSFFERKSADAKEIVICEE
jgi:hypothetical protein